MEVLKKRRRPVRCQLTKIINEAEVLLQTANPDKNALRIKLDSMQRMYYSLQEWDEKVKEQLVDDDVSEADMDNEFDDIRKYDESFSGIKIRLEKSCEMAPRPPSPAGSETSSFSTAAAFERRNLQLPKIELQKFNGELKEWLGFWSQFKKIHENPDLDECDKLHYLRQSMVPGTKPYEIVSSYPQTSANYPKVVEVLESRFGKEDILLQVYVRELLKLVISNVNSNEKLPFESLVLKLDSHLRSLKTLKLEAADPATWLFPLVESSIPQDILYSWERSPLVKIDGSKEVPPRTRLDILMEFLKQEVEIKEKMELAQGGFQQEALRSKKPPKGRKEDQVPTLAGFHISDHCCVFCGKSHASQECFLAMKMSSQEKKKQLMEKKACFTCLKPGHWTTKCKAQVKCINCGRRHHTIMCDPNNGMDKTQQHSVMRAESAQESNWNQPKAVKFGSNPPSAQEKSILVKNANSAWNSTENTNDMANHVCTTAVKLMTIMVDIRDGNKVKTVRAFLDPGSQRSYILGSTAEEMGIQPMGQESAVHSLFGAVKTKTILHNKYCITLQRHGGGFHFQLEVRSNDKICNPIPRIPCDPGLFMKLKEHRVYVNDVGSDIPEIEILIGGDIYGRLLTGKIVQLEGGITAQETRLGWVLSGTNDNSQSEDIVGMMVLSMTAADAPIEDMWRLEAIGIEDDTSSMTSKQLEMEAKERFMKTIRRKEDGRYIVGLPWMECHPDLTSNKYIASKRLERETKKLLETGRFDLYNSVLKNWETEFTELAQEENKQEKCHYVPHRPVFKESLTTPVRPVFDCSCKVGKSPSLNDCLHKGSSYIQLIPELLLRFREKKIGVTADIRKAFQMIEVQHADRDFLRFLWWENNNCDKLITYRHVRLPFGATCSPFILGAVLEYHLKNVSSPDLPAAMKCLDSLYVDNYVNSEDSIGEYHQFRDKATNLLADAKMDLRMWLSNVDGFEDPSTHIISILGLKWDRKQDNLSIFIKNMHVPDVITKRVLLSSIQKVFDPLGFLSPALIPMKRIIQKMWISKLKWDEPLPYDEVKAFTRWHDQISALMEINIPRMVTNGVGDRNKWTLHTFVDASSSAYAAVLFLRVECGSNVNVQLIMSKTRVAPVKQMTIPRLELMACLIGSRLAATVKKSINLENVNEYFWSDSSTALAWIKRDYNHGVFVRNRVEEIRGKTRREDWRHVPGKINPADLPSRGCSPAELLASRWWEGPEWLKCPSTSWPSVNEEEDEEAIMAEVKKSTSVMTGCFLDEAKRSFTFAQKVRIMAWTLRFIKNSKTNEKMKMSSETLNEDELREGELAVLKMVQEESFADPARVNELSDKNRVKGLKILRDEKRILRVKTRLLHRDDEIDFKTPILLPSQHPLTFQIIQEAHFKNCHAGTQYLMGILREKYWVLRCRRTIKQVIGKCFRCRRYAAKPVVVDEGPLPLDRVSDAEPFETTGMDLAGPLILRNNKKAWIVIYTCVRYRAVWLDIVTSLSSTAIIKSLKSFVEKHGRPCVIYSDNGTNFVGANNLFAGLDWEKIKKEEEIQPIRWKFNPPLAAWWGGIWERLIRIVKDLLRKTLGKACVTFGELDHQLKKIVEIMNSRPLTYVSEDPEDLETLTPAMFLRTPARAIFPESDMTERESLQFRHKYMKTLNQELKKRFRREYLSLLVPIPRKRTRPLKVGEVVFIGSDQRKRMDWPLGRILEFFPGRDGENRVARLRTKDGEIMRPVQRLHPLELDFKKTN